MNARVLMVEDDVRVRAALRLGLEDRGYAVDEAADAETALERLRRAGPPDAVLVDLVLGGADRIDGFGCIRRVRRDHDVPIIVVSGRDATHDIVAALEVGADDYVTKPFEIHEVTARLDALRRRAAMVRTTAPALVLDTDPMLVLSPAEGALLRGGEPVRLTATEFALLRELAADPGEVVTRRALLDRVWDRGFFGDERIVDAHVRRLRTKVERDPADPRIVVTAWGRGYRLDPRR